MKTLEALSMVGSAIVLAVMMLVAWETPSNVMHAQQNGDPTVEERLKELGEDVDAAVVVSEENKVRLDNQLLKIVLLKAAILNYRYELNPRNRAVLRELDEFGKIDPQNFRDRIWRLKTAIEQDNHKSHLAMLDLMEVVLLIDRPREEGEAWLKANQGKLEGGG